MQQNKEKALKRILLDIVCDKYVAPIENSLKTKIWLWGKRLWELY